MVAISIKFDDEDVEFMKEYKEAFGVYIQAFVIDAVHDKIAKIKLEEELKDLQRLIK